MEAVRAAAKAEKLVERGALDEARALLARATGAYPTAPHTSLRYGHLLLRAKQYAEAKVQFAGIIK